MDAYIYLLAAIILLLLILIWLLWRNSSRSQNLLLQVKLDQWQRALQDFENGTKDEFRANREEQLGQLKEGRTEMAQWLREFRTELGVQVRQLAEQNEKSLEQINQSLTERSGALVEKLESNQLANREELSRSLKDFSFEQRRVFEELRQQHRERFESMEQKQEKLLQQTEQKLERMRETVDEKLQKTLNERLSQSFETVGRQLQSVQEGLGEMRNLAQDVGGLKRVLSNVKMRGGIGEVQLGLLLEQILAPEQYAANVKTKAGSAELVEFAIRLPGRDDEKAEIWLPVDAKFPRDVYEQLQTAYDIGEVPGVEQAQRNLEQAIRKMAKDISDKYLDPPHTTDFAIMFLPFEGIYAEVVRKASLLEDLQRNYKVVVTGPTTLAAILNSLQMGFRTLAIQRRSGEVWQVLGAVKKEFETFGGLLQKAQQNIQTGLNQLDDMVGRRTRAIQRKLRNVEALDEQASRNLLADGSSANAEDAEDEESAGNENL